MIRYSDLCNQHIMQKSGMAKAISGHSTPKSAMAMAIVAIPVAPPLRAVARWRRLGGEGMEVK